MKSVILISVLLLASCGQQSENASEAKDLSSANLWAGQVQASFLRYGNNCQEGRDIDQNSINYDSWVRQRATQRKVCFQVWRAGITDRDNANLWRDLDVKVHYFNGVSWKSEYVSFVDRQGNNARYGTEFASGQDPFYRQPTFSSIKLPKRILNVNNDTALVEATLDFYFTINGEELKNSQGNPFQVAYQGYAYLPQKPAVTAAAGVLHPRFTCNDGGLVIGGGAGTEYIDITDTNAVNYLLGEDRERYFYGRVSLLADRTEDAISIGFSSFRNDEYGFPIYEQGGMGSNANIRVFSIAEGMKVEMHGFDQEGNALGMRDWVFRDCQRN